MKTEDIETLRKWAQGQIDLLQSCLEDEKSENNISFMLGQIAAGRRVLDKLLTM